MEKVEKVERVTHRSLKVLRQSGIKRPRFEEGGKQHKKHVQKRKTHNILHLEKILRKSPKIARKNQKKFLT